MEKRVSKFQIFSITMSALLTAGAYLLDNENAEFYFVDYNKVSEWNCKKMGYTNAYYIKREEL